LLHEFHRQHPFANPETITNSFLADNVCLYFFGLLGECMYFRCFHCSLVSKFANETSFHHPSFVRCDWEIRRHIRGTALKKKVKAEAIFCVLCAPLEHFWNQFGQSL
jgi:hypothetical protein